jgi:hypothetical protein
MHLREKVSITSNSGELEYNLSEIYLENARTQKNQYVIKMSIHYVFQNPELLPTQVSLSPKQTTLALFFTKRTIYPKNVSTHKLLRKVA